MEKDQENLNKMKIKEEVIEESSNDNSDLRCESTDMKKEIESEYLGLTQKLPKPKRIKIEGKEKKPKAKNFKCDECEKAFSRRKDLSSHKISTHGDFECKTCGKKFQRKIPFDKHKCTICEICNTKLINKSNITRHMETHHLEDRKKFECDFCGKIFLYKKSLLRHVIDAHSRLENAFKCDLCGRTFGLKFSLRIHMMNHHKTNCKICKKLITTNAMKKHIQEVHDVEYNFTCGKCPKMYKTRAALTQHLTSHDKKFACKICDKKFQFRKMLADHQVIHDNPDVFQCSICRKTSSSLITLKFHMKSMHGDKKDCKHQCEKCEYATHHKQRMENHRKRHEKYEEKLRTRSDWFKCEKCPALRTTKGSLKIHIREVHGSPVECDLCGKILQFNKTTLILHFKNVHKEKL